ncbi:MAG: hypothetical protein QOF43_1742 [Gaiellaceae bacterium]|nr:hypothetical protein [Gaiellaceae bacterium]
MRRLIVAALVLGLAVGCGGGQRSHNVRDVERVFHDAGVPFRTETVPNPYLQGNQLVLPGKLRGDPIEQHVQAVLGRSNTEHFTIAIAWVFDSDGHARDAVAAVPLRRWLVSTHATIRERAGNVIVVGTGTPGEMVRLARALADLR